MGLLEDLAGTIEKHPATNDQQHSSLVQEIWQRFGNAQEGMKLMDAARSQGLGGEVESWMKGQNKPVSADQAKGLVGEGWVKEIAGRTRIPESIVAEAVAKILPGVIAKVSERRNTQAA
ncbi:MAG TPA: YidB family protein [Terracidiphilus sp.]|nr:YidB family protein [Terracidiphilus sp.]